MRTSKYALMLSLRRSRQLFADTQRKLATLLGHVDEVVIEVDEQGIITDWNPRAEAVLGWKRREALRARFCERILSEEDRAESGRWIEGLLKDRRDPLCVRVVVECAGSRRFPALLDFVPYRTTESRRWYVFVRRGPFGAPQAERVPAALERVA